jgi:hypothetical protein
MRPTAIFRRFLQATLDYCSLQREMADRAAALETQAWDEASGENASAKRRAAPRQALSPALWDEWDQRHMP